MGKYIIAFGRAWACTNHAYKEIQEILLSIYGPKTKEEVDISGSNVSDSKGKDDK